jgi:hypothetical protein
MLLKAKHGPTQGRQQLQRPDSEQHDSEYPVMIPDDGASKYQHNQNHHPDQFRLGSRATDGISLRNVLPPVVVFHPRSLTSAGGITYAARDNNFFAKRTYLPGKKSEDTRD